MSDKKFFISKLISTFFYVGSSSKICPGTFGSIATLPLWIILSLITTKLNLGQFSIPFILLFILLLYFVGEISTKYYMEITKKKDPSEVVIDEVIGQLLALFITSVLISFSTNKVNAILECECVGLKNMLTTFLLITPVILFRIFDITKPNIIGYIDKNIETARGVMLDDVFAGLFAGIVNVILMLIFFLFI